MLAIFKREFLSFFRTMTGWLFLGITLVLYGFYFTYANLQMGQTNVAYALSSIAFTLMITVPILTMRVLAQERHERTDQLTLTSPVSVGKIVLGKYLALALTFLIEVGFMCLSPLIMNLYGDVSFKENYTALFGFFLYGLACLAVGLFASSLTENTIVAAVISFLLLVVAFMSSTFADFFSGNTVITNILSWYDFVTPLNDFFQGSFSIKYIVYYLSVIALCLILATQIILKRRYTISIKRFSLSAFSFITIIAVIVCVVAANFGMTKVSDKYAAIDMTDQGDFTLTSTSKKILKNLDDDVTIYVLSTKKNTESRLKLTLNQYKAYSKHIKVKYIDTDANPTFASKYSDDQLSSSSLIVVDGDKYKTIPYEDLFETDIDYSTYQQTVTGYDIEGQVTSAINYLGNEDLAKIYVLTGHDEASLSSSFTSTIQKLNAETKDLDFLSEDKVPDDADAVIIFAPQSDLSTDDVQKLEDYIADGGKVLINVEPMKFFDLDNLNTFLSDYGIDSSNGIIAETDEDYYYQSPYFILPETESTDATTDVSGSHQVFFPLTIGFTTEKKSGITTTSLMETSKKALAKAAASDSDSISDTLNNAATSVKKEDGDTQGKFSLGVMAENKKGGALIALGSAYAFTDEMDQVVSGRNNTLFGDLIGYMLPDDTGTTVSIPVKSVDSSQLVVSASGVRLFGLLFGMGLPILLIIIGIVVVVYRRKRQ